MLPIMGALSALRQFFAPTELMLAPMDDPFIQLDRNAAAEKLDLKARGSEQGSLNLPPSEMVAMDSVEAEIISYVADHYSHAQIGAANSLRTYDDRLNGLALLSKLSSINSEARKAIGEFAVEVANRRNRLSNSRDAIESSYQELREFKAINGLRRPAHAVPPTVTTVGIIAIAWLVETALNSLLLRLNDSMGLLGGIFAAATVGVINVGLAAFVGRKVFPRVHLRQPFQRALAWLGVLLWIAVMLSWNLLAAHYRDAKMLGLTTPESQALTMMGVGLESIYSWALLLAGVIAAILAANAGYKMDDPFPGYGFVTRRHNERCEDYAKEVEHATRELLDIRDDAIDEATDVRSQLEQQLSEQQQIVLHREAFRKRYDEFGSQLELVANSLLQEYRSTNLAARTLPAPQHFNERWSLPRTILPALPPIASVEGKVEAAEAALESAVTQIAEAFDAAIGSFEPLDVLKRQLNDT